MQSTLLFILNRRALGSLGERDLLTSLLRALAATAGMSLVIVFLRDTIAAGAADGFIQSLLRLSGNFLSPDDMSSLLFLTLGAIAGVGTYLVLNLLLGGRELPRLVRLIRPQPA